ncbi:MerR family transcriptional regulator [Streptomyces lydicus]|uniref:MerR family transcriptional regulator n=1 Tax=Streptomyces lydicus TaxID=47763 RepID=UPI0036C0A597
MNAATWKVGALAEASGLTVRTLHHWDTIGLLCPSQRTAGGHREYTEDDAVRLYQVLALRNLGLGLESIGVCLDSGVDPARVVRDHLAGVEASIAALETLRHTLRRLDGELTAARTPTVTALFDALRATGAGGAGAGTALRHRLEPDQLRTLERQATALGSLAHYLLEVEWPELYRRAERLRTEGVAPGDPRVRRLVARMDELSTLFTGGDTAVSDAVRTAWRADPVARSGDGAAPDAGLPDRTAYPDLTAYLDRARAAGS